MDEKITNLNGKVIIALSRSLRTIHQNSALLFRSNHLTMSQFAVLEALLHKGAMTIGGLIAAVLSSSGNMTVVIRNLEKQGFIKRIKDPEDNRSFLIELTESGRILIEKVFKRHMELVEEALLPLGREEKETVIRILKKL